ncbi:phytase esterase [Opitutaceae bacterium EW11]|nr:phytase esterase [Opitutaceae bacterium EW11]
MPARLSVFGLLGLGAFAAASAVAPLVAESDVGHSTLIARAVLPAATFSDGPISGQYVGAGPINHQTVPFAHQPVQGFSALIDDHDGTFLAMCDNGYGAQDNSADFRLRVYRIRPWWKTADGGNGTIQVLGYFELRDPDGHVPFPIVGQFTRERVLTGADFDPESMQRAADGTFWFGDEFGPYLLHTDSTGKLLEAPIGLPDPVHPGFELQSPQNPARKKACAFRATNAFLTLVHPETVATNTLLRLAPSDVGRGAFPPVSESIPWLLQAGRQRHLRAPANPYRVPGSGGFEGMAISCDGRILYPILEKALTGDPRGLRWIFEFDIEKRRYTANLRTYTCDARGISVPDFVVFAPGHGLVLERDSSHGDPKGFKAIYEIALGAPGSQVKKRLVADLLALDDPAEISGPGVPGDVAVGRAFGMPFVTIESLVVFDATTVGVINDNNYPFSVGRHVGSGEPDDNEFIVVSLPEPLGK